MIIGPSCTAFVVSYATTTVLYPIMGCVGLLIAFVLALWVADASSTRMRAGEADG